VSSRTELAWPAGRRRRSAEPMIRPKLRRWCPRNTAPGVWLIAETMCAPDVFRPACQLGWGIMVPLNFSFANPLIRLSAQIGVPAPTMEVAKKWHHALAFGKSLLRSPCRHFRRFVCEHHVAVGLAPSAASSLAVSTSRRTCRTLLVGTNDGKKRTLNGKVCMSSTLPIL
jgi:hypothetical protein